jgi:malate dehydrogenase (oxaloacetate-decarboxylating)(NADP+)
LSATLVLLLLLLLPLLLFACRWSKGKVLFASGSPFAPITDEAGSVHYPAQVNNAYIFPAVGFAAVLACSRKITDEMFVMAAGGLGSHTSSCTEC